MTEADEAMLAELERLNAERTQGLRIAVDGFSTDAVICEVAEKKWQRVAVCDSEHFPNPNWYNDAQFFSAAANAMPRLLTLARAGIAAAEREQRLREALQSYLDMMAEWQSETTHYLADRHTPDSYINCVIYMQDGPEQRARDERARAALSATAPAATEESA